MSNIEINDFAGDTSTEGFLEVGETAIGTLSTEDDVDFIAIDLSEGDIIRFDAGDNSDNVILSLLDADGTTVFFDRTDFSTGRTFLDAEITEAGTYFLDIITTVFNFTAPVDYTILTSLIEDDFAGNITTSGALSVGETASGRINFDDDSDFFAIDLTAGDVIRFEAQSDTGSVDLDFFDENGDQLIFLASFEAGGITSISTEIFETATYFVSVSERSSFDDALDLSLIHI